MLSRTTTTVRVQEVAKATGTEWGQSMTAGDIYTVAGNSSWSTIGDGGSATVGVLLRPSQVAIDSSGNEYIADADNNRIQEVPATTGTEWGHR